VKTLLFYLFTGECGVGEGSWF